MSNASAFHRAILDDPDDDFPRLIYADAIEESGSPERADFIRTQVELARTDPGDPRHSELHERQGRALALHRRDWMRELPELEGIIWSRFRRGFVDHVDVNFDINVEGASRLAGYSETILASAPIQSLWFRGLSRNGARLLADNPLLHGILELDFTGLAVNPDAALDLATSEGLERLESIHCGGPEWTARHAQRLAQTRLVGRLERLKFSQANLRDEGVIALAAARPWARLRELTLKGSWLGEAAVSALLNSGLGGQLRRLELNLDARVPRSKISELERRFGDSVRLG